MIKSKHAFLMKKKGNYFILKNKSEGSLNRILYLIEIPFLLIRWVASFVLARSLARVILAPRQVSKQRAIHHISMSDDTKSTADDLVIVNLIPHESRKLLKDLMLSWSNTLGFTLPVSMKARLFHFSHLKDKQHIDKMIDEICQLISGHSTAKRCEGKSFTWDKIHFKGIERLDEPLRAYFFSKLIEKCGLGANETQRTTPLDFFTLETQDGAILDSVAIAAPDEEKKPMSERKFIISCLARRQNYINFTKYSAYSARKIGCTMIGFNYRGIDFSQGMVWTQDNMVDDIIAQVERLLALGVQAKHIGLEGDCLGGAVATIAAANLHKRDYPVKLYNLRSFRSTPRFLAGYLLPEATSSWLNPLTYLKYIAAGFSIIFLTPVIWLSGWRLNAAAAWNKIPFADKDYSLVRMNEPLQYDRPDGVIHDGVASIASYIDEQRDMIRLKMKYCQTLTQEEKAIVTDRAVSHYFKPAPSFQLNDDKWLKASSYRRYPHFFPRRSLVNIEASQNNHDHMIDSFQAKFQSRQSGA